MKSKKPKRLRRITALVLCVSMLVTSLPTIAFAATEDAQAKETTEVTEQLSASEDITSEAESVPVSEVESL